MPNIAGFGWENGWMEKRRRRVRGGRKWLIKKGRPGQVKAVVVVVVVVVVAVVVVVVVVVIMITTAEDAHSVGKNRRPSKLAALILHKRKIIATQ